MHTYGYVSDDAMYSCHSSALQMASSACVRMASSRYCTELKVSVGGNDRAEDAKGLWQSARDPTPAPEH